MNQFERHVAARASCSRASLAMYSLKIVVPLKFVTAEPNGQHFAKIRNHLQKRAHSFL